MYLKARPFVKIRTTADIIHFWPEAPEDLAYLRKPHHHFFDILVSIEAKGENREISCEHLKDWVSRIILSFPNPVPWSCETIARKIATKMSKNEPIYRRGINPKLLGRKFDIIVLEDNTQGGSFGGEFSE